VTVARAARTVAATVGLALAAGCGTTASPAPGDGAPGDRSARGPTTASLRAAAALPPCPPSSGTAVRGGLPELTLPCLGAGPVVRLAGLRDAPTVVNLWAGWCAPCREEVPAFSWLAVRGRVRVLGVLTKDTERNGLAAARGFGIRYPSVVDEDGRLLARLGLPGLPATVFLRPDGTVAGRHVGPALSDPQLTALVRRHLGALG
jgi:thiol-disulfide isomerase/thioredoxin